MGNIEQLQGVIAWGSRKLYRLVQLVGAMKVRGVWATGGTYVIYIHTVPAGGICKQEGLPKGTYKKLNLLVNRFLV